MTPPLQKPIDVVLTGGPCGGKTTAIALLVERLHANGYAAIIVDEAASRVFSMIPNPVLRAAILSDPASNREFQNVLITAQIADREQAMRLAALTGNPRVVVIRDRAVTDDAAYIDRQVFDGLLADRGLTYAGIRDEADLVIHLVTAADGAEAFYTTGNNSARYESPVEARAQDRRTHDAWTGHRNRVVIDNSTDFTGKLERVWATLARELGIAGPRRATVDREIA